MSTEPTFDELLQAAPKSETTGKVSLVGKLFQGDEAGGFVIVTGDGAAISLKSADLQGHALLGYADGQAVVRIDIDSSALPEPAAAAQPSRWRPAVASRFSRIIPGPSAMSGSRRPHEVVQAHAFRVRSVMSVCPLVRRRPAGAGRVLSAMSGHPLRTRSCKATPRGRSATSGHLRRTRSCKATPRGRLAMSGHLRRTRSCRARLGDAWGCRDTPVVRGRPGPRVGNAWGRRHRLHVRRRIGGPPHWCCRCAAAVSGPCHVGPHHSRRRPTSTHRRSPGS